MFTLEDLRSGNVHSTVDDAADASRPFRLIYTQNDGLNFDQSLWYFISYPVKYRPINFSSVDKARDCLKAAVLNGFWNTETLPAQNYRFVELVNHVWRLIPIGCDKVPADYIGDCTDIDDIEVSECNSNLVWLVHHRIVDTDSSKTIEEDYRQWCYFDSKSFAITFGRNLGNRLDAILHDNQAPASHVAEVYVEGMTQDFGDAILSNDIPVDWNIDAKL